MTVPNAGDPSALVIPGGAQYLTAPDGTTVYAVDGSPVDLTGVPLRAAPKRDGANATILSAVAGVVTVGSIYNALPGDVGATLVLAGTFDPANAGSFPIAAVLSPNQVQVTNAGGVFPDGASGAIRWALIKGSDLPEGDALSELAANATPLNVVSPAPGPARFADYDPRLQPVIANDSGGLFSKVQRT